MTLVSHDHSFIFLKTRKTAGTSVEMYRQPFCTPPNTPVTEFGEAIVSEHGIVGQRLGKEGRKAPPPDPELCDVWFSHQKAATLKRQLPARVWRNYRKISVVRNPFKKVLSSFFWRRRNEMIGEVSDALVSEFRKFATQENFKDDREVVFIGSKFLPEFLVRTEHLSEDLRELTDRLGLDASRTSLPVTKSSGSKPRQIALTEWYDEPSVEAVRKKLAWMFDAGNYPQDLP